MAKAQKSKSKPTGNRVRLRKQPAYKHFRLSRKIKHEKTVPGMIALTKLSFQVIWQNKKLFGGIGLLTAVLTYVLVQGYGSSINFADLKESTNVLLGGQASTADTNFALFGQLVSAATPQSGEISGAYRTVLSVVVSLAVIWSLRQVLAGEKIKIRDSFYKGMYPLIPFLLVMLVIGVQLLPFAFGNLISNAVFSNDLAITAVEKFVWVIAVGSLYVFSIYLILSSIFALYIVTLPDMTPLKALRSARGLVLHRRVPIATRLAFLLIVLTFITSIIILPLIYIAPGAVEAAFYLVSAFVLIYTHSYMYNLYRGLL